MNKLDAHQAKMREWELAQALEAFTRHLEGRTLMRAEQKVLQKWTGDPEFDALTRLVRAARSELTGRLVLPPREQWTEMEETVIETFRNARDVAIAPVAASPMPAGTDSELVQSVYAEREEAHGELAGAHRAAGAVDAPSHEARSDAMTLFLEVDEGAGEPRTIELKLFEAVFGRGSAPLRIEGDLQISRHHARLLLLDGHVVINDLESRNGTYVDGMRIYDPTPLDIGAIVEMGRTRLVFEQVESDGTGYARATFTSEQGDTYVVDLSEIVFGRGKQATVRLDDPSQRVSRRHARLDMCDEHVFLTDLGSTNGILVNQTRIDGSIVLEPEMLFQLGGVQIRVIGMMKD